MWNKPEIETQFISIRPSQFVFFFYFFRLCALQFIKQETEVDCLKVKKRREKKLNKFEIYTDCQCMKWEKENIIAAILKRNLIDCWNKHKKKLQKKKQ